MSVNAEVKNRSLYHPLRRFTVTSDQIVLVYWLPLLSLFFQEILIFMWSELHSVYLVTCSWMYGWAVGCKCSSVLLFFFCSRCLCIYMYKSECLPWGENWEMKGELSGRLARNSPPLYVVYLWCCGGLLCM